MAFGNWVFKLFLLVNLVAVSISVLHGQCQSAAISLPDSNQPVVNPSVSYCVSFVIDPSVTGHPTGVCMNLQHTWQGDLSIRVQACGNTLMLLTRPGNPGGSCNAGSPFGSPAGINGQFCFSDVGPNPDNTLPAGGGNYGLSPDRCNVNTVDSFAELAAACGNNPYTFTICITDHAFANVGFASNITPTFPVPPVCGCTDPLASNFNPAATVDDGSCDYTACIINFSLSSTPATCGNPNGVVNIVGLTGGSGNYNISWSNGASNTTSQSGLTPGIYTVTVTNSTDPSCFSTQSITLTGTPGFTLVPSITPTSCGLVNGRITLSTPNSPGPFNYQWAAPLSGNTSTQNNLAPGTYSVTVTNTVTNCQEMLVLVILPSQQLTIDHNVIHTSCNLPNGSISINIQGGSGNYSYAWSTPSLSGANNFNLSPGNYHVTITDGSTGCTKSVSFEILGSIDLLVETDYGSTSCGLNNGYISAFVTQGVGPYTYNWYGEGPNWSSQLGNLSPGTYYLEVIDNPTGCNKYFVFNILPSNELEVNTTVENTKCNTDNGSIQLSVLNGSGNYSYFWFHLGDFSGPSQTNFASGGYAIEVTDLETFCSKYVEVSIEESLPLDYQLSLTNPTCGLDNGVIEIQVLNGSGSYNFQWSNPAFSGDIVGGVAPGIYSVVITDVLYGCQTSIEIDVPNSEILSGDLAILPTSCGLDNGQIQVNPSNGSGNFQYQWSHNPTLNSPISTNLSSNLLYTVTVTDQLDGCSMVLSGTPDASVGLDITYTNNPLICGPNDASISISILNGSDNLVIDWNVDSLVNKTFIEHLPQGSYSLNIMDLDSGCTFDTLFVVEPLEVFVLDCTTISDETILGNNDGVGSISFLNGLPPFNLFVSSGVYSDTLLTADRTISLGDLTPGIYFVVSIDAQGCEANCEFEILAGPCGLEAFFSDIQHPFCNASSDGYLNIEVNNYEIVSYLWEGPILIENQAYASDLPAGIYMATVTDILGCQIELSYELEEPPSLVCECEIVQHETFKGDHDGILSVDVSGGTAPYILRLSLESNTIDSLINMSGGNYTFSALAPGNYVLEQEDANGCKTFCTITVNEGPCELTMATEITPLNCFNGSDASIELLLLGVKGNYIITWDASIDPANINDLRASNVSAGIYTISVQDDVACISSVTVSVQNPTQLTMTCQAIHETEALLGDGSILMQVQGYNLPITATLNGPIVASIEVNNVSELIFDQLVPGIYQITITDSNGCTAICQSIVNPAACEMELLLKDLKDLKCNGIPEGIIEVESINGTGDITYFWSGSLNYTGSDFRKEFLYAGTYLIQAFDFRGCSDELLVTISQPAPLNLLSDYNNPTCNLDNGSISIGISGGSPGYEIQWNDGDKSLYRENLPAGQYAVSINDENECLEALDFDLEMEESPTITDVTIDHVDCHGASNGSIAILVEQGQPAYDIQWSNGASGTSIENLGIGNYRVSITDQNNCLLEQVYQILQPELLTMTTLITIPECGAKTGQVQLFIEGGTLPYQYSGDLGTNGPSYTDVNPGRYQIVIADANGCEITKELDMQDRIVPESNAGQDQYITCLDSTAILTAGIEVPAGYNHQWRSLGSETVLFENVTSINVYQPGAYEFLVMHPSNGCIGRDTVHVLNDINEIVFVDIEYEQPSCHGKSDGYIKIVEIEGGMAPYIIRFNGVETNANSFNQLGEGPYQLEIAEQGGCSWPLQLFEFEEPEEFSVTLPISILANRGDVILLEPSISDLSRVHHISWASDQVICYPCQDLNLSLVAEHEQVYTIRVNDERGCSTTAATRLFVKFPRNIYIPTAFTPNNDQVNDHFYIYGDEYLALIKEMQIFDRWGSMVYQGKDLDPKDPSKGWDGNFRDRPLQPGTFIYTIKVEYSDGFEDVFYGEVHLMR